MVKTSHQSSADTVSDGAESLEALSFEQALSELESIVARLEDGTVDLENSIALYERGTRLKAHCEAKLKAAQTRIDKIVTRETGEIAAEPADLP